MIITIAQAALLADKLQTGQSGSVLQGIINALPDDQVEAIGAAIGIMEAEGTDRAPATSDE